jgi:hypothetical protein
MSGMYKLGHGQVKYVWNVQIRPWSGEICLECTN